MSDRLDRALIREHVRHLDKLADRLCKFWSVGNESVHPGPGWFSYDSVLPPDPRDIELGALATDPHVRYASPEYLESGRASPQSDMFGFGVHGFILLTSREPFLRGNTVIENMTNRVKGPYFKLSDEALPGCPSQLTALVDRCLRIDPRERFVSFDEILKELHGIGIALAG